ncbi:hypothetical protein [Streptomyces sp. VRA16 Mangrove soil]|uniref:hypothetical protein n=1 Tax=Streptomyces sp. VRA16 Mangrove soil TaxID=2817434 RepID=UPI001A9ED604|nr:hypothetical protein [Streptomyces sp. VRA16 Mangrove soil]MBO1333182.1 hypothetical protein [Streptomyces sp. VRA16 Mangrove soil]
MTESNGTNAGTETMERGERVEATGSGGSGRHRGAVAMGATQGEQPEPHGRHRGAKADEM